MISSVNSVSFKASAPMDPLSRPGKYTVMPEAKAPKEGKHKVAKWLLGLTATAVAVSALLIAGNKNNWFKNLSQDALANAGIKDKCSHYLNKAGDFLNTKCWEPLKAFPGKAFDWFKSLRAPKNTPSA